MTDCRCGGTYGRHPDRRRRRNDRRNVQRLRGDRATWNRAPPHRHRAEAEASYIVDGTVELTCGGQTVTAGTGDFVYAPQGIPHKYAMIGDRPARMLLMFSRPRFESLFAEAGTPLDGPAVAPATPARTEQLLDKYDLELLEAPRH